MIPTMGLTGEQIEDLFPCYLLTDGALVIRRAGRSIAKLLPDLRLGEGLDQWFVVERPIATLEAAAAMRDRTAIQIRSIDGRLHLAGCILEQPSGFLFCLSHAAGAAATWGELGLTADDFSQADQWLAVGTAIALQSTLMDELQEIVSSLRIARDEAMAANRAKSTFLSVMSHEIRTPLNGILGMTQAMLRDATDAQQLSRLDIVRQSGEALLAILNDILDLSRIEAGQVTLESIEFDLAEVLGGAYSAFTALANKKGLSFNLDVERAAGRFIGDPTRIRQIVYNLLSNALKFTESGRVEITAHALADQLEIVVTDTGVGIAPDKLSEIFTEFRQADASISRRFGGTGLGLSIARDLATLMDGSITVESKPGEGSRFTVHLRVARAVESERKISTVDESPPSPMAPDALRVLAAEDNLVNQLVLRTLLEQFGLSATIVDNGAEAVETWEREPWDVILMDIQMPVMGGIEAARRIREHERLTGRAPTPIIALTANSMTHQVAEYRAAGISGLVAKPIQASALVEALIAAVEDAGAASA
jgi:signal transduction histidine kinase/CheY-like chemotaxis protein